MNEGVVEHALTDRVKGKNRQLNGRQRNGGALRRKEGYFPVLDCIYAWYDKLREIDVRRPCADKHRSSHTTNRAFIQASGGSMATAVRLGVRPWDMGVPGSWKEWLEDEELERLWCDDVDTVSEEDPGPWLPLERRG